jgi:hypothetical protein
MNDEGLVDGRKVPDEVMDHLRRCVVHAIREKRCCGAATSWPSSCIGSLG